MAPSCWVPQASELVIAALRGAAFTLAALGVLWTLSWTKVSEALQAAKHMGAANVRLPLAEISAHALTCARTSQSAPTLPVRRVVPTTEQRDMAPVDL